MFEVPINLKWLEEEVVAYEQEKIEKNKILFYGHSIFTRWGGGQWGMRRLDEDIRMKDGALAVVNHGFGTSTSEELLYYYPRLVRPWEPRGLVIMSLANDGLYGMSVEQTLNNIFKLCHWARTDFPGIRIYLVEPHPYPKMMATVFPDHWNSELHRKNSYSAAIDLYAQTHSDTTMIRLWNCPGFFEAPGEVGNANKIRKDIFDGDGVHFNQEGYDILAAVFREQLDELL